MVVFQRDARINGELIEVLEFINPAEHMVFDSLSQGYVMRRKDQVHGVMMVANTKKIQRKCFAEDPRLVPQVDREDPDSFKSSIRVYPSLNAKKRRCKVRS